MNRVTVLMPVYNAEKYIAEAIDSILYQSYNCFDFLIINDGSTDNTINIINSYSDKRIKILENTTNLGLIKSLNIGLDMINTEYIARMDSDDVSLHDRLKKQIGYMDKHQDVGICGSFSEIFCEGVKSKKARFPVDSNIIKATVLFNTAIPHPSMIIRKSMIDKYKIRYRDYPNVEDLDFCIECSYRFKMANIPEVLLKYRISDTSVITTNSIERRKPIFIKIYESGLRYFDIIAQPAELDLHFEIATLSFSKTIDFLDKAEKWLILLLHNNQRKKIYESSAFEKVLFLRWYFICRVLSKKYGLTIWKRFNKSSLVKYQPYYNLYNLKLLLKCII